MPPTLTTSTGAPVDDNQNTLTAGEYGPALLQDFHLIDKLAHFDRERIPERVVHAKGAGAHGYFEVTHDVSELTRAKFLGQVGKRTPLFLRFSTVGGEKGSADTARDPRGFAIKFYTEEGNFDLVGNNTPIFFVRDPIKFPDFIHTQKRNPRTNLKDPDALWDFASLVPESLHQYTILFSSRGTPDGFRFMHGFGSHTFKLVNLEGKAHWVKFHMLTDQGVKNLTTQQAVELAGTSPDYATEDLFDAIERGEHPSWTLSIQVMPLEDAATYRWNIFDVTKVWPHGDYPLRPVGKLVLNRNPENFFAETEQAAFSPSNMVPGIEPSFDRMLQGRLFSYPDTHRHRLGVNHAQIPINAPIAARVHNYQRDGFMAVTGNGGSGPNYEPNSRGGPAAVGAPAATLPFEVSGLAQRYPFQLKDDDFVQPSNLYKLLPSKEKEYLHENMGGHLRLAKKEFRDRQLDNIRRANKDYALGVESVIVKGSARF